MNISELLGKTLSKVEVNRAAAEIIFYINGKPKYKMLHHQECCEGVDIKEIVGEIDDLVGSPILEAEVSTNIIDEEPPGVCADDYMKWTFYKIGTNKGHVNISWFGSSNGYYSVDVDFEKVK